MGTAIRVLVEEGEGRLSGSAPQAIERAREFLRAFDRELTRFDKGSGLAGLNADPAETVRASPLLRTGVRAAISAAICSGGVLDPTIVGALERIGYDAPMHDAPEESLREAIRLAPPRCPAKPNPESRWSEIRVHDAEGTISRPPGVRIELGGVGKGLAADLVAAQLANCPRYAVDCGGDLRVGGLRAIFEPHQIGLDDPFTGEIAAILQIERAGIATSGIDVRLWRRGDGRFNHHLLDPSTGESAWTGVVAATAIGHSSVEAEISSKLALLSGPEGARRVLKQEGGLIVHDDGQIESVGPVQVKWM